METLTRDMKEKEEEEEEDDNNNNNDNDNKNKDTQEGPVIGGDGGVALPSVEEAGVRHASDLLRVAGDVPLDVARTILAAHYRTLRATNSPGRQRVTGGFIQCPSCSTPWIAGLCKPRLLGCPRDPRAQRGRLRRIIRRSETLPGKLTSSEKSILARHRTRGNVIEVSCLVCRHKKHEFFPLPERVKEEEEEEEEEDGRKKSARKKKKRKGKEINAGLHLSSSSSSSSSVLKKKKGSEIRESPIFTTSTRPDGDTHTNTHTPTDAPDSLPRPSHKNNSSHPRFKARAKVLLGKDAPGGTLHNPASAPTPGKARERKRTVENLKRVMSREKVKSESCSEKNRNSLSSFLDSLF